MMSDFFFMSSDTFLKKNNPLMIIFKDFCGKSNFITLVFLGFLNLKFSVLSLKIVKEKYEQYLI